MESITQAAVPFFLGCLALEAAVAYFGKKRIYRLNDAIADLSLGTVSQLTGLATGLFAIWVYALIFEHASLNALLGVAHLQDGPIVGSAGLDWNAVLAWSAAFVLIDHQYYWAHRTTHTYNLTWGVHVAHHSSPEYNLAVALRQSGTQSLVTMWFFFPLAVLGVSWKHYAVAFGINLVYQFWIHTRLIGRMGVLEYVLNTPSHHRVHHGRNPKYIDKNHGGVFIVWDRLYGTFQVEEEEPIYGVTTPLESYNPVWSNVHHFAWLLSVMRKARGLGDKLRVLGKPTGWRPEYLGGQIVPKEPDPDAPLYDPRVPRGLTIYAVAHFALTIGFTLALQKHMGALLATGTGLAVLLLAALFAIVSLSNVAGVFDRRAWLARAEPARLLVLLGAALLYLLRGDAMPLDFLHGDAARLAGWTALAAALASLPAWTILVRPKDVAQPVDVAPVR